MIRVIKSVLSNRTKLIIRGVSINVGYIIRIVVVRRSLSSASCMGPARIRVYCYCLCFDSRVGECGPQVPGLHAARECLCAVDGVRRRVSRPGRPTIHSEVELTIV